MPLVRLSVPAGKGPAYTQAVGAAVHDAMVATIDVPTDDRFQILTEHDLEGRVYDRGYFGVDRSDETVFVHITMRRGRTPEQKRALYATLAATLEARAGVRPQDVMVVLAENEPIDWSFGYGVAQMAPG